MMERLNQSQYEVYRLIKSQEGIKQSEVWKEMDMSAGKTSQVVRALEDMGIINRDQITFKGNSTYQLSISEKKPRDIDYSLLLSGNLLPPFIGDDDAEYDSDKFSQWFLNLQEEYE